MGESKGFWQHLGQLHPFGRICLAVSCGLGTALLLLAWGALAALPQSPRQLMAALALARGCCEAVPALLVAGTASALLGDYVLRHRPAA